MSTKVSIVLSAKDRHDSVKRCLYSYAHLSYDNFEIIFVDDGSKPESEIEELVNVWAEEMPIKYYRLESTRDRTPAISYNYGFDKSDGEFVIFASSDILLSGHDMCERFLDQFDGIHRISVLTYVLDAKQTTQLDELGWVENHKLIENMRDFWDTLDKDGQPNRLRLSAGLLTHITGQSRERWKWLGLFRNLEGHLFADQDIVIREQALGIGCNTLQGFWGYHQFHDNPAVPMNSPEFIYENERQARLLEPAKGEK